MSRLIEKLLRRSFLDELSKIHNRDIIRKVVDNGKVVCDEDIGQSHLFLKILHQV